MGGWGYGRELVALQTPILPSSHTYSLPFLSASVSLWFTKNQSQSTSTCKRISRSTRATRWQSSREP